MYNARKTLILLLLMGFLIISCTGQNPSDPTPDVNAILTAGVGTFAAAIFQTQTAMVPPATATPTATQTPTATVATPIPLSSPTASATQLIFVAPLVTFTAIITGTPPTANPTTLASGCNNLALIRDETVPAGTVFKPEEGFTKVWKVANTGSCNWVYFYHLVFVSGDSMGGEPQRLGKVIEPGKWTQLSLNMQAPKNPGKYNGYWRFADQSGTAFGSTLGVSIEVKASSYP
ncbi:MAG: hypothetical protein L0287_00480 [Anaerolineae bacterium]|nr:hypothetical protein [Anaerolineae bacterium]MCI0608839.1 hypothetical protein [Anaerolineae bacterium]